MSKHLQAKRDLEAARRVYLKAVDDNDVLAAKAASDRVRKLQADLGAAIADGANPCPFCGEPPHGMEQPLVVNNRVIGAVYEVGCLGCKPFKYEDGTTRKVSVRGGLLPAHTVEAWNAGPDYWSIAKSG